MTRIREEEEAQEGYLVPFKGHSWMSLYVD